MIITYAGPGGRRVILADANPGIGGLRAATWLTLDEFQSRPAAPPPRPVPEPERPGTAAAPAAGWRSGDGRPPPNLGPPPPRLDWRTAPFLTGEVADRARPTPDGERCRQRWRKRTVT